MALIQIQDPYNKNQHFFADDIINQRMNEVKILINNKEAKIQLYHIRKEIEKVSLMYQKFENDYMFLISPENKNENERNDCILYYKKDVLDKFDNYLLFLNRLFNDLVDESNYNQTVSDEIKNLKKFNRNLKNKQIPVLYYNEQFLYWSGTNQSFADLIIYFTIEKTKKYNDIILDNFLNNLHKYIIIKNERKHSLSAEKTRALSKIDLEKNILNLYSQETLNHYYIQIKYFIQNYM